MTPSLMTVGGVRITVASAAVAVQESAAPSYASFCDDPQVALPAVPDIDIDVAVGQPPVDDGPVLFDCEGAWRAYGDDMGYRIVLTSDDQGSLHLMARSNADTSRVVIHVGESWSRVFAAKTPEGDPCISTPFRYPLDQILLMTHLASRRGVIVHSAGLELDGAGFVFPGVSGAGKTTLSRLLAGAGAGLGEGLLSDDRIILRGDGSGDFTAWGTPWPGDAGIARNASTPLTALFFLVQDEANTVVPLAPAKAAERLLPVISCPWYDGALVGEVLSTVESLVSSVPCFEFHFIRDESAVEMFTRHAATLS